jgi:BirA family biotin operon repressor/biotin-[acetyl-CoA-carboxylase] ligase
VLGVGINFDVNIRQLEKELKDTPNFYGVASLKKFKNLTSPVRFVQVFLLELEKILELLNSNQTNKIIKEWSKRSSTIGITVELSTKKGKISGKAVRIDKDGALVIAGRKNTRILAGDIVHLT